MATVLPVSKTLIKYNSNNLEENDEEEKEPINIEFTEENQILIMIKMILTLDDQMYRKKFEEDIALANFIESLQKQTD